MKHRDASTSADGDRGDHVYCFVGVNDKAEQNISDELVLTADDKFPYVARCSVSYEDGSIEFLDCVLP